MKTSNFRIVPLATEIAEAARRVVNAGSADHALITVDSPRSSPCRHCLQWAQPGERVVLFPYAAIPSDNPYSETGPIFVHANECRRYSAINEYPVDFRNGRVFRAYDLNYNIIDAQLMNGSEPEVVIESLLQNPDTAFVDVRSVTHGCFTLRLAIRSSRSVNCFIRKRGRSRYFESAARISSMHRPLCMLSFSA